VFHEILEKSQSASEHPHKEKSKSEICPGEDPELEIHFHQLPFGGIASKNIPDSAFLQKLEIANNKGVIRGKGLFGKKGLPLCYGEHQVQA